MIFRGSITMTLAAPVLLALATTSVAAQGITDPGCSPTSCDRHLRSLHEDSSFGLAFWAV